MCLLYEAIVRRLEDYAKMKKPILTIKYKKINIKQEEGESLI